MPARGQKQPYRQRPADFELRWPQVGWEAAKDVWGAHSSMISRWIDECGRERMVLARKRYIEAERIIRRRALCASYRFVRSKIDGQ
jgi:hypothetical protein